MFLRGLKERSGYKFLNKVLANNNQASTRVKNGIHAMGCIVDIDILPDTEVIYGMANDFNLRPNEIKIIGYKSKVDKVSPYSIPMFSDADLGWNGNLKSGYLSEFLERDYDVVLNYYAEEKLPLMLASAQSKARIKVGFTSVKEELNNLILNVDAKNFEAFQAELKKYLTILKEI